MYVEVEPDTQDVEIPGILISVRSTAVSVTGHIGIPTGICLPREHPNVLTRLGQNASVEND